MIQAEFVISAVSEHDFPKEGIPEVVFAGRSNVGKSSLINRLVGNEKLARTSSTPGKTQSINFYRLNGSFFFVDLPGYGYAKAAKTAVQQWKRLIEHYFQSRSAIVLAIQIVDSRMPPTESDLQLSEWLERLKIPYMLVATKTDKLSSNQQHAQGRVISNSFGGQSVVMSSAKTGTGCKEIWKRVLQATAVLNPQEITINRPTVFSPWRELMPETTQRRNTNTNANGRENGRENGHLNIRDLKEMNIASLTQVAKDLNVPGYTGMRKQELIFQILKAQTEAQRSDFLGRSSGMPARGIWISARPGL